MPLTFDLQGGWLLAAARLLALTGLLSAFGTATYRAAVLPRIAQPDAVDSLLLRLLRLSAGLACAGLLAWLVIQSRAMADTPSLADTLHALPIVLMRTSFGHILTLEVLASAALLVAAGWRHVAFALSALALLVHAGHSHAWSMDQRLSFLLACDILHLWGAGAWLGGLLPLLLTIRYAPPAAGLAACRWFSPVGQASLYALAGSALVQGWVLTGSIAGLVGTAYGLLILVKLALFGILFGFAWMNRYRFAPRLGAALHGDDPGPSRRLLMRSITLQTGFALAIIIAAIILSGLPPAMHLQPNWPFGWQPSLDAAREDPDIRAEVLRAAAALGIAVCLPLVALGLRRFRLPAAALGLLIALIAAPHLSVLLVPAYPTSFFHSPTGFTTGSIAAGRGIFMAQCTACHGVDGTGHGPDAARLPIPPANLTAAHLWMHTDGELFWWVSQGIESPEGGLAMPGFAGVLSEDERWSAIDYIRAHNAGWAYAHGGSWPHLIQAPAFGMQCGGLSRSLADLRGHIVRLVIGPPDGAVGGMADLDTVFAAPRASGPGCIAHDETVAAAYATATGLDPAAVQGWQFLIDGAGWLRAAQAPGGSWADPRKLEAALAAIRNTPAAALSQPAAMPPGMNMDMKM